MIWKKIIIFLLLEHKNISPQRNTVEISQWQSFEWYSNSYFEFIRIFRYFQYYQSTPVCRFLLFLQNSKKYLQEQPNETGFSDHYLERRFHHLFQWETLKYPNNLQDNFESRFFIIEMKMNNLRKFFENQRAS